MSWRGWAKTPARKPVFVGTYLFAGGLAVYHVWKGIDIPPGILSLVNNMLLVVSGMYGLTSSSEMIYGGGSQFGGMLNADREPYYYNQNQQQGGYQDESDLEGH